MNRHLFGIALVLGLISAIGPFAIDMYLPALPSIGQTLGASTAQVQASLMVFFAALGTGQILYGPVSDMVGRRAPLFFGLGLFAIGSVGCALAPSVEVLIAFRFVQGLGACAGMVIPRAVVRDLHTGLEAARLMSLLMLVFSVSPILAPLVGSFVIEAAGWRAVFWFVLAAAIAGIVLVATTLEETRPPHMRVESSLASALASYLRLLKDRHYMALVMIGAFGMSSFFAYLSSSSFVLIDHYGLTPREYAFAFSFNAVAFIGSSQFTARLGARFGLRQVVKVALMVYIAVEALLFGLTVAGVDRLDVMIALLFVGYACMGLVVPTTAVLALEEHGAVAGTASALMGTLQFVTGAIVIAITGRFFDSTSLPMIASIAACALIAWTIGQFALRGESDRQRVPAG
ncbi:multidrug effflux MFS transporter [soil metagenome]